MELATTFYAEMLSSDSTHFKIVTNVVKMLIDLPFYLAVIISSIFQSVLRSIYQKRKKLGRKDRILVTGAASGLGQRVVYKLAKLFPEAVYVLWDVNEKGLEETARKCREHLGALYVHTFPVDLSHREDVVMKAALVRETVGDITLLWNNAGLIGVGKFLDNDPEQEERVIRVNLLSNMWTIREFLPDMIEKGKGHLVTTCSALSFYRWTHLSSYVASKYGLRGFLDTLKLEMSQHPKKPDITFSTFYPGFIKTPMIEWASWEPRYQFDGVLQMDLDSVAEEFVDGILKEKEEIKVPGLYIGLCDIFYRILPSKFWKYWDSIAYRNLKISS